MPTLLFTMIERRAARPPVTYNHLPGARSRRRHRGTVQDVVQGRRRAIQAGLPDRRASCTAELIQDDPGGLAKTLGLSIPVIPLELPSYQKKENWGAAETFYRLVRTFAPAQRPTHPCRHATRRL